MISSGWLCSVQSTIDERPQVVMIMGAWPLLSGRGFPVLQHCAASQGMAALHAQALPAHWAAGPHSWTSYWQRMAAAGLPRGS